MAYFLDYQNILLKYGNIPKLWSKFQGGYHLQDRIKLYLKNCNLIIQATKKIAYLLRPQTKTDGKWITKYNYWKKNRF